MPKPKILLTRVLPPKAMEYLETHVEFEMLDPENITKERLINGVKGKEGLLCLLTETIDAEIMDAHPNLKVIANVAVGFNNIDVAAASQRGIPVTNTPGVLTETSADLAFALLMATARRIPESENYLRSGQWEGWGILQFLGTDVHSSTLGIIGLGRIGKAVVKRAKGFDMKTVYWNRTRLPESEERALGVEYLPWEEVLKVSDFISVHVAYNQETHHLISAHEFELMKDSAIIINTARGPIIDEKALVKALQDDKIAGAGLDVFEGEPKVEPELLAMKNVVLLPHIGSATVATRTKMGMMAATNLVAALEGKTPPNIVNPEIYD